ncbi:MAG TPA: sodium-translocating pyrophosphatase [Candidatus Marinimicrobia bacterium]|jgi:K(+)-stimulated pyrophosphate-energized sodium pump|nr:sodium-translocating pyrophosphatase [Candidatus Neomarinimicrobiota bacterium]HJM84869.1 sodium-translocating pyrophosphatase [Candidatus Neomarinimicrobiota bacterium]
MNNLYYVLGAGVLAMVYAFWKTSWINNQDEGSDRMKQIGASIADGAMAFLKAEYRVLAIFVVIVACLLAYAASSQGDSWLVSISFLSGAIASALAGYLGMRVATKANNRTTNAAQSSLAIALNVAFTGGSVMGLSVVGLGVLGVTGLYVVYDHLELFSDPQKLIQTITGFSLGASSIALFARVGGGIYTKAADVGADLVGKVEAGIPEDHPLNPATIADNVGDNVGDVAGMGADLFESYVGAIIGSMVLGWAIFGELAYVTLPLYIAGAGIIVSIIGTFMVSVKEGGSPQKALNIGEFGSSGIMVAAMYLLINNFLPAEIIKDGITYTAMGVFGATVIGLIAGLGIGLITEHYTGTGTKPVKSVVDQSITGSATNIIAGLGVGMQSTFIPVIIIAVAIVFAHQSAGLYGIAMAALGMLANTGIQLAVDAYGPISDNAGGIAEMAGLPSEVRERTDKLDAVGNTTAAIGKGFAIGSAALTTLALFAAFSEIIKSKLGESPFIINISEPIVMAALFIGAMLPFLFSSLAMGAVGRAAMAMIEEVRRQFRDIPELKAALEVLGKGDESSWSDEDKSTYEAGLMKADHEKCIEISTQSAIKEMLLPGLLAVVTPILIGLLGNFVNMGPQALGGLLAGVTVSGVAMAIFQSNAGGAWDNAKKMIEEGTEINGQSYGKGSDVHKAAVVGDTVGDPFKDTSGPSLNILIKLMSVVSLVIAPFLF